MRVVFEAVVEGNDLFYICSVCGKCYWLGSHLRKILCGRLKDIVVESDENAERNTSGEKAT